MHSRLATWDLLKKINKYTFWQDQVEYFRVNKVTLIFQENNNTVEVFGSSLLLSKGLCCIYFLDFPAVTFQEYLLSRNVASNSGNHCQEIIGINYSPCSTGHTLSKTPLLQKDSPLSSLT